MRMIVFVIVYKKHVHAMLYYITKILTPNIMVPTVQKKAEFEKITVPFVIGVSRLFVLSYCLRIETETSKFDLKCQTSPTNTRNVMKQ
jgi:hypothetical protein